MRDSTPAFQSFTEKHPSFALGARLKQSHSKVLRGQWQCAWLLRRAAILLRPIIEHSESVCCRCDGCRVIHCVHNAHRCHYRMLLAALPMAVGVVPACPPIVAPPPPLDPWRPVCYEYRVVPILLRFSLAISFKKVRCNSNGIAVVECLLLQSFGPLEDGGCFWMTPLPNS